MKDLTDREPLDAIARAMKIVVECFQAQREAPEVARKEPRPPSPEPESVASSE